MLKQIDVCNETSKHHFLKSVKINTTLLSDANVPVRFRAEQRAGIANHSSRPTVSQLYQADLRIIRHRGHKFPRSLKLLSSQNWKRMASSVDCNPKFSERIFSTPVMFKAKVQAFQLTGLLWWQKNCSIWKHDWTFGRTRNTVRTRAAGKCFHSIFEFSQTFTSGYSIETRRTCFLFFLEYTRTKKRETTSLLWSSNCKFSLLAPSLRQQLVLVLCLHRVLVTRFLSNQRAYSISLACGYWTVQTQFFCYKYLKVVTMAILHAWGVFLVRSLNSS